MTRTIFIVLLGTCLAGCRPSQGEYDERERERAGRAPRRTQPADDRDERERDPFGDDMGDPLTLPVPAGNVRVVMDRVDVDATDREAYDIALRYQDRGVTVSAGKLGAGGLLLFGARKGLQAAFRASHEHAQSREVTTHFLMLREGSRAGLETVRETPVLRVITVPVYRGTAIVGSIEEEVTGSGMWVHVHSSGPDGVDVELLPYFHRARDGTAIEVTELRTRVLLEPGRPYVIMGSRSSRTSVAGSLLSYRRETGHRQIIQVLTVEVGR